MDQKEYPSKLEIAMNSTLNQNQLGIDDFHNKRKTVPQRKQDQDRDELIIACTRALRMNDIGHIKDVLRFAVERAELDEPIEIGEIK